MPINALAARILNLTADNLRPHETIQGWLPGTAHDQCMTEGLRDLEVSRAREFVLIPVAKWATVDATRALIDTLTPPVEGTVAAYADSLRQAAADLTATREAVLAA